MGHMLQAAAATDFGMCAGLVTPLSAGGENALDPRLDHLAMGTQHPRFDLLAGQRTTDEPSAPVFEGNAAAVVRAGVGHDVFMLCPQRARASFERAIIEYLARHPDTEQVCLFAQPINRIDATGVDLFAKLDALAPAQALVDALAPEGTAHAAAPAAHDHTPWREGLQHLMGMLRSSDMGATDAVERLAAQMPVQHRAALAELQAAVAVLDFERAQGLCQALLD